MSERKQFRAIKGTRDILPPDSALWNWFEHSAREVFESYNFGEIRTPIFEETSLFARSIGANTDVVSKEMYTFEKKLEILRGAFLQSSSGVTDAASLRKYLQYLAVFVDNLQRGITVGEVSNAPENVEVFSILTAIVVESVARHDNGQSEPDDRWNEQLRRSRILVEQVDIGGGESLRPEATASVCRAYIEHNMQALPGNVKLYYMGPMFRRERPQKGRFRQFYQIGAEVLGQSDAPAIDAELIEMLMTFFNAAGLTGAQLFINSIGDKNCRPQYVETLRATLRKVHDQLGPDSQRRIETNPLRVLDSKIPEEQPIIENLPHIADHLCDACRDHFAKLRSELDLRGVGYEINWRLVRGLDYYMRTTFEIIAPGLGSQNAVCGGGRYDGLVELLGGPPVKGTGFAIGTDRVILSLQEANPNTPVRVVDVFVAWMGAAAYAPAVRVTHRLRQEGIAVELPPEELKFKKSLSLADKLGARYALIIGENEVASGELTIKRLADGEQAQIAEDALVAYLGSEKS